MINSIGKNKVEKIQGKEDEEKCNFKLAEQGRTSFEQRLERGLG